MFANLALAGLLVVICVVMHFTGLLFMLRALRHRASRLRRENSHFGQGAMVMAVVLGLLGILSLEMWAYALTYLVIGALPDFHTALYFSITTFSTIGYGDIVLAPEWRLFGVTEAVAGLLFFGWSTAFFISVIGYMRTIEHHWPKDAG